MLTRLKRYLAIAFLLGVGGWLAVDGGGEMRAEQRLTGAGMFLSGLYLLWFFRPEMTILHDGIAAGHKSDQQKAA